MQHADTPQNGNLDAADICSGLFGADIASQATGLLGIEQLEELMRLGAEASLMQAELDPYFQAIHVSTVITSNQSA